MNHSLPIRPTILWVRTLDRYTSDTPVQPLSEIAEYSDLDAVATRLVDQFDSLPWRYLFSFELPNNISEYLREVIGPERTLGPGIKLVRSTADLNTSLSLNSPDKAWNDQIHRRGLLFPSLNNVQWTDNIIILQIEAEGFVGPYGGALLSNIERKLKAFFGLCIALRMLHIVPDYSSGEPRFWFYVHRFGCTSWDIDNRIDLNTDTSRVVNSLQLNRVIVAAEDEGRRKGLGRLILTEIEAVFSAGRKNDTILLAAQWLFDSYSRKDVLLNYVQAMVVLEILLGDKAISDELGLSQLLRNRCAYMIASSHADRQQVLQDFDEIYRVRSLIVHRGKAY